MLSPSFTSSKVTFTGIPIVTFAASTPTMLLHHLHAFVELDPRQHVGQLVAEATRLRAVGDREGVDAAAPAARRPLDLRAPAGAQTPRG